MPDFEPDGKHPHLPQDVTTPPSGSSGRWVTWTLDACRRSGRHFPKGVRRPG
ncbi:MAG TPA: hypothetical protein VKF14_14040 [Candidatus Dormibacteraeota bacterium]|nr:hypothetical protein [Candidatus Dormibacteraeota bacterium]